MDGVLDRLASSPVGRYYAKISADRALTGAIQIAWQAMFSSQVGDLLGFIEETRELSGLLGVASVVGLVWSGYWLFQTMELVFNHFYGAPARRLRQQIVMSLAMTGLYAALTSLS